MVVLGRLVDPYGVRGWVRLHPFGDDPLGWKDMPVWWVAKEGEPWVEVKLKGLKAHGEGFVALLDGADDRNGAEALKGSYIAAPKEALPVTGKDEYYWADLIGLTVINTANETLGQVAGLIETGANDVLRVAAEDGVEHLLPFVAAVVLAVERDAGVIRVDWGLDW